MKELLNFWILAVFVFGCLTTARGAERVTAEGGCPDLIHEPVSAVYRGTPAEITATVECPTGTLGKVFLQVRLTEVGKPVELEMTKGVDDVYSVTVPASMFAGLARFWYYVDARGSDSDGEDTMAQTRWHAVLVLDPIAAGGMDSPPPAPASSYGKAFGWFVGGAAAVGAAFIIEHNSGNYHSPGAPQQDPSDNGTGSGDQDEDDQDDRNRSRRNRNSAPSTPDPISSPGGGGEGPCSVTGNEQVSLGETSPCSETAIQVFICGHCVGATLRVETSWGPSSEVVGLTRRSNRNRNANETAPCSPTLPPVFYLPKPYLDPIVAGSQTISVYANGQLIGQFLWPSSADVAECIYIDSGGI